MSTNAELAEVRQPYVKLFGRGPAVDNPDGTVTLMDGAVSTWAHYLAQGGQQDQLEALLMGSTEYVLKNPQGFVGDPKDIWVQNAYRDIFNRTAGRGGRVR